MEDPSRVPVAPGKSRTDYLVFEVARQDFAIAVERVQEISPLGPVTRVPGASPAIRGVLNLRGSVVPVVDTAARLGRPRIRVSRRTALVHAVAIAEGAATVVALMVDAPEGMVGLAPEEVLPAPPGLFAREPDLLLGLASIGPRLVPLLDVDVLVDPSRFRGTAPEPGAAPEPAEGIAAAERQLAAAPAAGAAPALPACSASPSAPPSRPREVAAAAAGSRAGANADPPRAAGEAAPRRAPGPLPAPSVAALARGGRRPSRPSRASPARPQASGSSEARPQAARVPAPGPQAWRACAAPPPPGSSPSAVAVPADGAPLGPDPGRAGGGRRRRVRGRAEWLMGLATAAAALLLLAFLVWPRRGGDPERGRGRRALGAALTAPAAHGVGEWPGVRPPPSVLPAAQPTAPEAVRPASRSASPGGASPAADASEPWAGVHEVLPGDSLWAISGRYLGDPFLWPRIFAANRDRIGDPDLILPGQRLTVPTFPDGIHGR